MKFMAVAGAIHSLAWIPASIQIFRLPAPPVVIYGNIDHLLRHTRSSNKNATMRFGLNSIQ